MLLHYSLPYSVAKGIDNYFYLKVAKGRSGKRRKEGGELWSRKANFCIYKNIHYHKETNSLFCRCIFFFH